MANCVVFKLHKPCDSKRLFNLILFSYLCNRYVHNKKYVAGIYNGSECVRQEARVSYPVQQGEEWLLVCRFPSLAFLS